MFARRSSFNPTTRPSRRTFVKGLAIGVAAASVGLLRQPAWAQSRQRRESAVLSGTEFDLRIGETEVNLTGAARTALTINDSLPGPLLRWREGDTITLNVSNSLPHRTVNHTTTDTQSLQRRRPDMCTGTLTPTISVDIGGQLRIYQAFVTTARPEMDGPSTLTLYTSTFSDVAGFAANPIPFNREFGRRVARIVLVNATELEWHRATYRSQHCLFAPVDAQLLGLQALQRWLWQRLGTSQTTEATA